MSNWDRRKFIKKSAYLLGGFSILGIGVFNFFRPIFHKPPIFKVDEIDDISRLNKTKIVEWYKAVDTTSALEKARSLFKAESPLSICGIRHSQGGQSFGEGTTVIDISQCRNVISFDDKSQTISVTAGTRWSDIQDYVDPFGLSVGVMQSSNIFTVGGSVSVNVHGRDPSLGTLIETIKSLKILLPSGEVVEASRKQNYNLFKHIIGGYGLFGLILEVELYLQKNLMLKPSYEFLSVSNYADFLKKSVINNDTVKNHYARLYLGSGDEYLSKCFSVTYKAIDDEPVQSGSLKREESIELLRAAFHLTRRFDSMKKFQGHLERLTQKDCPISRNNVMRPDVAFLDYFSPDDTDILQEYFVPLNQLKAFLNGARAILKDNNVNLLNITTRWVRGDNESALPYCRKECIALVLYVNMGRDTINVKAAKKWTRNLIDLAVLFGGTYYLPYQNWASKEQFEQTYPMAKEFFVSKRAADPQDLIRTTFFDHYG